MTAAPPDVIKAGHNRIAELCRRYGVRRLELFGSVAAGLDHSQSDIDFLVLFDPANKARAFDNYFGLREDLAEFFGRNVDLLVADEIKNPYLARELEVHKKLIYAAPSS